MLRYIAFACCLATTTSSAAAVEPPTQPRRLYHWPYLKFTRYLDAHGVLHPQGDIDARRAFYWGRVLGCDGVAINVRGLTRSLHEGNWFEPIYQTATEKQRIFDLMRRFQRLYTSYGCNDNFLHLHAHPLLKQHPTHIPSNTDQWRTWVLAGMRQRAELMRHMDIQRILIDLEFADQKDVSTDAGFWYALGQDIATTLVEVHPAIRIGFYPDLYYHMHQAPKGPFALGRVRVGDLRHALLAGLYAGRGQHPLWDFIGYTYTIVDGAIAEPGVQYVWDLAEHLKRLIEVHHRGLGPAIEFMPGRWELGASHAPSALFAGLFKQPNLSIRMLRRDYGLLLAQTNAIAIWDHGYSWDPAGAGYKRFETDAELSAWKTALAGLTLSSRYHKHLLSQEHWHVHVPADTPLNEKLEYFQIIKAPDGAWLVSGRLAPDFADYVNLTRELLGKDRLSFPLHSKHDLDRARYWQGQGYFAGQSIRTGTGDPRWPQAAAIMAARERR